MKELDVLADALRGRAYPGATRRRPSRRLPELLEAQDPLIYAYCFGQQPADAELSALIERITAAAAGQAIIPRRLRLLEWADVRKITLPETRLHKSSNFFDASRSIATGCRLQ
jgi:succinate dehydrogenase flavin-adding protein (antitoxin of CptAB toxin-antitoxin module)